MSSKPKYSSSNKRSGDKKKKREMNSGSHGSNKKARTTDTKSKHAVKNERQRRHADIVNEAKTIWNKLRLRGNTAKERRALMDQLMPLIRGKVNQIALQHDASRVVQAAIQFGTKEERLEILTELCAQSLVELCKSQYAHFVVLKVIKYCHSDKACVKLLVNAFKGNMAKLAVHAVAASVVESLFATLTAKQTAELKQEFYGPHFALFAADTIQQQGSNVPTLQSNLEAAPEKKESTLESVRNLVNKGMEKSLYGYTYFQEIFAEYLSFAKPNEIRAMAGSSADNVIHLLSSRSGTRVAASLIAYGTAKDRKRIMKSLKGYTRSGLMHRDAYLAILRLVQLTDDTVSVQKNILSELLAPDEKDSGVSSLLDIALSDCASKLFLLTLVGEDSESWKKCFDPYELSVLFSSPTIEEDGKEVPTSKKDKELRRQEVLAHLREPLISLCREHASELLRSRSGSMVLREVYSALHPQDVVDSIIETCQESLSSDRVDDKMLPLFEDFNGHLAIKNLILSDTNCEATEKHLFSSKFLLVFESHLMEICSSNRGAFVVEALCKVSSIRERVVKKLDKAKLAERVKKGKGSTAGFKVLLDEINS